jgi:hypothetical protein
MKLTTIALASAFALSSTAALANTVSHEPSVRTHRMWHTSVRSHRMLHRGVPLTSSGVLRPNYGNPNGNPDGPTTLSGTGSSEFGGSLPGTSGYN